jgi:hypothetical protein
MFSLTLVVACLLVVVYELNYPFDAIAKISPEAFELAPQRIQQLG